MKSKPYLFCAKCGRKFEEPTACYVCEDCSVGMRHGAFIPRPLTFVPSVVTVDE